VILSALVEKLGENLAKIRQGSENAILALCNHSAFGVAICIDTITRNQVVKKQGPGAKKTMNSNKLIIGKYQTMSKILGEV
jgi:hypothetical protein